MIAQIQEILGVKPDTIWGPVSQAALNALIGKTQAMSAANQKERHDRWLKKPENKARRLGHMKKYRDTHKDEIAEYNKAFALANPEKTRRAGREWSRRAYLTKPMYRLKCCVRAVMTRAFSRLAKGKKIGKTMELIGCSADELRHHIQSQFKPGMAWNNHGVHGWHIDHKRPLASFNLFDPDEQRKAFHYTNLQPLWCRENILKGDRWDG